MAVSFKVEDVIISALRDRAMFNTFAGNQSYVIKDIGQELEVLYSAQSFIVQLGTGEAVICGGSMLSEGEENTLTLGQNESGYIVIRIDLSQTGTNICQFYNTPTLVQGNINNGSDYIYDLPLYQYVTNSSGVQNMNDIRSIKETSMSFGDLTTTITGLGAGKTLSTLKQQDGLISATFQNISITKSQVSDFAHTHGNITNDGKLNADVAKASGDKFVLTDASDSNKIVRSNIALGTSTSTYLRNDGAWGTPANTTYSAGDGLSLSGTTFSSVDHINQASKLVNANWGNPTTYSWTATANGWLVIKAENNTIEYYIDNVKIGSIGNYEFSQPIPVKKGQVIKAINSDNRVTNNNFTVYACK